MPINAVLEVLGDTQNKDYPIYRTGSDEDNIFTMATVLYDLGCCASRTYKTCFSHLGPAIALALCESCCRTMCLHCFGDGR